MGRIGVSDLLVFKAADQLAAEGIRPTVDTVRTELGDTGSRTTINRYLKEWRERREQRQQMDAGLGDHLTQVLKEHATQLLASLEDAANRKFEAQRTHYEKLSADQAAQLQQHLAMLADYEQRLASQTAENAAQLAKSQQLQAQLMDTQDELHNVRDQLAKQTGRREALETALSDQQRQVMALQKEIGKIRDRNEILTESLATKTSELHAAQQAERDLRTLLKQRNDEIRKLNQSIKSAQKQQQAFGDLTRSMTKLASAVKSSNATLKMP